MRGLALALGGGGARAFAHVGVLEVLHREKIPVVAIAGTSMGAMIGAMWAAGLPPSVMRDEVKRIGGVSELLKLIDLAIRPGSITVKGSRITEYLAEQIGDELRIEDLKAPFAATATDIISGREVELRSGPVVDAVRASLSLPGLFEPVERDGMRLVDGGVLNNVPVALARSLADVPVVAVDVLPSFEPNRPGEQPLVGPLQTPLATRWLEDLVQVQLAMVSAITACNLAADPPDLVLRPAAAQRHHRPDRLQPRRRVHFCRRRRRRVGPRPPSQAGGRTPLTWAARQVSFLKKSPSDDRGRGRLRHKGPDSCSAGVPARDLCGSNSGRLGQ